jgi:hypothetical protein
VVVLPAPFGPRNAKMEPSGTSSERVERADGAELARERVADDGGWHSRKLRASRRNGLARVPLAMFAARAAVIEFANDHAVHRGHALVGVE